MGLVEIASAILSRAERRVEICAQNLSNMTTPGYKARSSFDTLVASSGKADAIGETSRQTGVNFAGGTLQSTGNPFDLAISGAGFFVVRDASGTYYTRDGQFSRSAEGRLVTAGGKALQSMSGDLVVGSGETRMLADGTVLTDGEPVGKIAIAQFEELDDLRPADGDTFTSMSEAAKTSAAEVRQGMLEASNVSTAAEMIAIMSALRGAGAGQRAVQLYDDLMGRAVNAFSQQ